MLTQMLAMLAMLATSEPLARSTQDPVSDAASAFLDSLDETQRAACTYEFSDAERKNWQPVPFGTAGVKLEDLSETQRERLRELLKSVLSEEGLATVDGVMVLEAILVAIEQERGRASRFHGAERYFITIYGDPASADTEANAPWAWRIEGHHLSFTFTCKAGEWVAHGPLFVGSQPARVQGGEHDAMRLLGSKDDNVRALIGMLDAEQRARAVGEQRVPGNVVLTPGRDDGFGEPRGLPASEMTQIQRAALLRAISEWAKWLRKDLAEAEVERMRDSLEKTTLYWLGGMGVDEPHYWRIVGPHFSIEYAAPERDPDHVHALWRDLENDFGGDLLRRHLEKHHAYDHDHDDG